MFHENVDKEPRHQFTILQQWRENRPQPDSRWKKAHYNFISFDLKEMKWSIKLAIWLTGI